MKTHFPGIVCLLLLTICMGLGKVKMAAQDCLPEGIIFDSQAGIDAFANDHPGCTTILGDVIIQESTPGNIKNLNGLSVLTAFGDYLEIHDNEALTDLTGLGNIETIAGGLNIFGNPGLEKLTGLEKLNFIGGSLRIALNHQLRSIEALNELQTVVEDLTVSDNLLLSSLFGLHKVDTIGGYLLILTSGELTNLRGLDALRGIGKGLLIESNEKLIDLRGLDKVTSIGGNCIIVNNQSLRSLDGLNAVTAIDGKLQVALNPFLEDLVALKKLKSIRGLLQIYANVGLKSLSGLENIDAAGIEDLAILASDILTVCHVQSICDYLGLSANQASISMNGNGCNVRSQILERCQRRGTGGRPAPPKDPVFFPNPTSGLVTIDAETLADAATYEVADALGRILLEGALEGKQFDLSELAAGIYFVKIKTEELELLRKIVKVN
ncbi:T9SS type A sorting domain-containing protein [Flavilitoribacter nigricans]|nr:T9SS type A sorting domain-containing protein [Flavilitoribacter nigricans]